jgi:uncharacterized membrane protein
MSGQSAESATTRVRQTVAGAVVAQQSLVANDLSVLGRVSTRVVARPWPVVVWAAVVSWTAVLLSEIRSDYLGFRLARFDLGNMVQAVWSTAHGRPLETTLLSGEQAARLDSHVDPILVLFAPFFALWPSPMLLAGVQVAACALGALPVFWLARRHLASDQAAALLALSYLAYPWLAWTALDAMHPVTLAIPLFLYAIWFLDSDRLWGFAICAFLIAATGELMGLPLAGLGLWYWLARGHRRSGVFIAASGLAWAVLAVKVVIPAFHGGESPFYERFATVGGSPEGVLRTALTNPGQIVSAVLSRPDLVYVAALALPLAASFLLAPGLAAVALPQLGVNTLSDWPATTDARHHYIAAIVPFLVAASALGLSRVSTPRRVQAATMVCVCTVASAIVVGPWPGAPGASALSLRPDVPASRANALEAAVALVPMDASVSATNRLGSHLSARRYFYSVPLVEPAEWIVLDAEDPWIEGSESGSTRFDPDVGSRFKERVRSDPRWKQVFGREGVYVFQKVPAR